LPGDDETAAATAALLADFDHEILHFALYDYPGRALPLGWALTEHIIGDMDDVFALTPNNDAAVRFATLVNGEE
jgi:hypothetical protein